MRKHKSKNHNEFIFKIVLISILALDSITRFAVKAGKHRILCNLCNELNRLKAKGLMRHGIISKLIKITEEATPGIIITRHDIRNM